MPAGATLARGAGAFPAGPSARPAGMREPTAPPRGSQARSGTEVRSHPARCHRSHRSAAAATPEALPAFPTCRRGGGPGPGREGGREGREVRSRAQPPAEPPVPARGKQPLGRSCRGICPGMPAPLRPGIPLPSPASPSPREPRTFYAGLGTNPAAPPVGRGPSLATAYPIPARGQRAEPLELPCERTG